MSAKTLVLVVVTAVTAFAGGMLLRPGSQDTRPSVEQQTWTCSMHPQVRRSEPGLCPICAMDLVAVGDQPATGSSAVHISPNAEKLMELEVAEVKHMSAGRSVRLVGLLGVNPDRQRTLTAWVSGRIERLGRTDVGESVSTGDMLAEIYSPELYAARQELTLARKHADTVTDRFAQQTLEAARDRLRGWGLSNAQIKKIETNPSESPNFVIESPAGGVVVHRMVNEGDYVNVGTPLLTLVDLSTLRLTLQAYEQDLPHLAPGQTVSFHTQAVPGETFTGRVSLVEPSIDHITRTAKVRVDIDNTYGRLMPEMFVQAVIEVDTRDALLIPASAPLITGKRAVVYVMDPDRPGHYESREVKLGSRTNQGYVVVSGLTEGERVVAKGAFKIDSELQIQGGNSMMHRTAESVPPAVNQAASSQLPALMDPYVQLSQSLSRDDVQGAARSAGTLAETVKKLQPVLGEGADAWTSTTEQIREAALQLSASRELDQARNSFVHISELMIKLYEQFGWQGTRSLYLFHCPMAFEHGADWIQGEPQLANPYYGSSMLRCGSLRQEIQGTN